jgi:hypothetical protein
MDYAPVEPLPEVAPPPSAPGGYRHAIPLRFNPKFLRWMVPITLIIILILSFFPWVGLYPGGVGLLTQNGWQTAFGGWSNDPILKSMQKKPIEFPLDEKEDRPKASVLMIFSMILLCIAVLLGIAFIVFNVLPVKLPPIVQTLKRWQGLILGGVALVALLFMLIQALVGFQIKTIATKRITEKTEKIGNLMTSEEQKKVIAIATQSEISGMNIHATVWFRLSFFLLVLATIGALLEFWTRRRGNRPFPKLEFAW